MYNFILGKQKSEIRDIRNKMICLYTISFERKAVYIWLHDVIREHLFEIINGNIVFVANTDKIFLTCGGNKNHRFNYMSNIIRNLIKEIYRI